MLIIPSLLLVLIYLVNNKRKNHGKKLVINNWNTDERCQYCGKWTNDDYKLCSCNKEVANKND